jgi:hypothetical protein
MNKVQTPYPNLRGTDTPYPINNVIDLNPELDKFDKWEAIVLQTDGTYYEIWVGQGTNIKL